ncbi:hypothetical protein [Lysobacter gummosus]|uniref:hypothetical protein n=1 Tax=Lysobacter gummosus TaxID=262324 RepID=UPI0036252DC2
MARRTSCAMSSSTIRRGWRRSSGGSGWLGWGVEGGRAQSIQAKAALIRPSGTFSRKREKGSTHRLGIEPSPARGARRRGL